MRKSVFAVLPMLMLFHFFVHAGTYWVSPAGGAAWDDCESPSVLSIESCCSLATANANALPGDVVLMRGGSYNIPIKPANSGFATSRIIFRANTDETPIITNTETYVPAIHIYFRSRSETA